MRRAVLAEWTKLRSVPGTGWLLLAIAGFVAALGAALAADAFRPLDEVQICLNGVLVGQALVAVLAALCVTSEYGTRTIHPTLMANPRRWVVLAAKAVVVSALALMAGAVGTAGALGAGRLLLDGAWPAQATWRAAVGTVLYLGLVGLLSLGLGAIVRDTAGTIITALLLLYAFPLLAGLVSDPQWQRWLRRYGPNAGLSIQATRDLGSLAIAPWPGLGVLAAYAFSALAVGGLLFHYRDVTV